MEVFEAQHSGLSLRVRVIESQGGIRGGGICAVSVAVLRGATKAAESHLYVS